MTAEFEPSPLEGLRRERIAACLLESMPSEAAVHGARMRFLRSRATPRRLGVNAWLITVVQGMVLGLALGLASAAAAAFIADRTIRVESPGTPQLQDQRSDVDTSLEPARERGARADMTNVPAAPAPRAAFEDVEPGPTGAPQLPAVGNQRRITINPTRRTGPPAALPQPTPSRESAGAGTPPATTSGTGVAVLPPAGPASVGSWERAANALEAGDWRGADNALNNLTGSADAYTRDAAALARAQLWISHGRGEEVRATLQRLAQYGTTPLIRRRAADLLHQLLKRD